MSYEIVAVDECGDEVCVAKYFSEASAYAALPGVKADYPEYSRFKVGVVMDKAYFSEIHNDRYANDEYDLY